MPGFLARIACSLLLASALPVVAQVPAPASATTSAATPAASPPAPAAGKAANPAGAVDLVEGDVQVYDANRARRTVKLKDAVNEGDSVVTGTDGELHLNMQDGGYLAVRPNSVMQVMKYQANGNDDDTSVIGIVKGALRSVTGFIGKFNSKNTRIVTPTATIGIRGTDHETLVREESDAFGEAGTYDKVNAGGTFIQTAQGRTDVTPNSAGFAPKAGNAAPRLLARVPTFFKPTRNEHLIEGRHAQIQSKLQQLREQRRQQVIQRNGVASGARAAVSAQRRPLPATQRQAEHQQQVKGSESRQRQAENQKAAPQAMQQRQQAAAEKRQQAAAEVRQKVQAARQQAAANQKARQEKMQEQRNAQQQKRKKPEKEKD
jgi:hypothetical protein